MNKKFTIALGCLTALTVTPVAYAGDTDPSGYYDALIDAASHVTLGPRPLFLVHDMSEETDRERELKSDLLSCAAGNRNGQRSDLTISHRGAPLMFPEHTLESYLAGAQGGAGIIECDVTFTADNELVCRHSQCDLHYTTNIVETDLAEKCSVPPEFDPDSGELVNAADIQCCTSDITLAEFRTLEGKMEGADREARSIEAYLAGTPGWRTGLYDTRGTLMSHADTIELFKALGVKMTPELKAPSVEMPFNGMSQQDYAQKMIDEYKAADVPASDVYAQSFLLDDVLYWIENEPEFGEQAVYLDGRYDDDGFDHTDPATWSPSMQELADQGVKILAPPMWMLLAANPEFGDGDSRVVPSTYAEHARDAGLELITWTLERSGPLAEGGQWYHSTTEEVIRREGDKLISLDVLVQDVGVIGIFSDWPATVAFYDNCMQQR
ncbi:glycerophosphodiester phosphodiesterase family protein [Halomonas heilongjiangensis]|uniref:glycerophosphodiester phosphodiesterase n=1 Tax=Halomonas heilongjiangensis TaxID=1387883 RepID=A0A2N7TTU2_9GAMM|nr:glycerophosphodiester phosphodiesterase family protein [Halomonas heilongjiangensis]PMR71601.1 glycerophosphodiester phosphodiesterase [Halomonas heilongjiangensis]PXX94312.1 glycerophosphodiester phosphodiesterase [Halomonas heilongjiangensis]